MVLSNRPRSSQKAEQHAHLVVDLLDQPHVDGNHLLAHLVARERLADALIHERAIDGMRIARSSSERTTGSTSLGAVHGVVGRRRDVGPVRLDVGEVQAPWPVAGLAR